MGLKAFFKKLWSSFRGKDLERELGQHQRAADALDTAVKELLKK